MAGTGNGAGNLPLLLPPPSVGTRPSCGLGPCTTLCPCAQETVATRPPPRITLLFTRDGRVDLASWLRPRERPSFLPQVEICHRPQLDPQEVEPWQQDIGQTRAHPPITPGALPLRGPGAVATLEMGWGMSLGLVHVDGTVSQHMESSPALPQGLSRPLTASQLQGPSQGVRVEWLPCRTAEGS